MSFLAKQRPYSYFKSPNTAMHSWILNYNRTISVYYTPLRIIELIRIRSLLELGIVFHPSWMDRHTGGGNKWIKTHKAFNIHWIQLKNRTSQSRPSQSIVKQKKYQQRYYMCEQGVEWFAQRAYAFYRKPVFRSNSFIFILIYRL